MLQSSQIRIHELELCGEIKSLCDELFRAHTEWPFSEAKIEQYGTGNYRRSDLRIFLKGSQTPILCGEVKLPGTPEGRSPYDAALIQDAFEKADNIQCPYFFTWNINGFVLFDRSKWNLSMIKRRLRDWNLNLNLRKPSDCRRAEVIAHIKNKFLPELFAFLAEITSDQQKDWGMSPDLIFIRSLETHLEWPVNGTSEYLAENCRKIPAFAAKLQTWMTNEMSWTFNPSDSDEWLNTLNRAARTLSYTFCNRVIFYEAIRAKYPGNLPPLNMPAGSRHGHDGIYQHFRSNFHLAVQESGDYEPIFYPDVDDQVGSLIFASDMARQGWKGVLANIAQYNFREIPYDIIGGIFQRLIAPEERQKFGQFFTNEDIIDVINAFCINRAGDIVLDPACGSGSFLIRAYHRKGWLSEKKHRGRRTSDSRLRHNELLRQIFGCDIALFAAHLATLNLASRQILENENYPFIARGNFFEVVENQNAFCYVPDSAIDSNGKRKRVPVPLPELDAVIGNPPYVRQESIQKLSELKKAQGGTKESFESTAKNTKEHFQNLCSKLWPDLKLSGRSDLHCYFWPVAASLLKEKGYFGFLTSSSWLDVEYGFALQRWILKNFKIIAIMESLDEPWFPDARIKTCITILQRCSDPTERSENYVRFVRFQKPIREILGENRGVEEVQRQTAADKLRKYILSASKPETNELVSIQKSDDLRIITVRQFDLWKEGVRAWELLRRENLEDSMQEEENGDVEESPSETNKFMLSESHSDYSDYAAGKWGRFVRAPDIYFKLIREYGNRFVRLGDIAEIRRGITSGCDAFFMPHDVTEEVLGKIRDGLLWRDLPLMTPCKLKDVENGNVRIIRAGDNTLHPMEKEFIRPEIHSLMQVDRPVIRASDCSRVVLWVNQELQDIANTFAAKYIRWGAKQTFASKKSKPVHVPERSTCSSRPKWYDLTTDKIGVVFWPKAQKYRHIVPTNPEGLVCNCNLYTVVPRTDDYMVRNVIGAILNSTLIAFMKCFYGRYVGSEGTLKTEVIDSILIEVPSTEGLTSAITEKMLGAFNSMMQRNVTHLLEDRMLNCHSNEHLREILRTSSELPCELQQKDRQLLDDAVFELIGVGNASERKKLIDELYKETTEYYRYQRTQDIQSMVNRSAAGRNHMSPGDLAGSIWDSLTEKEKGLPVTEWIKKRWQDLVKVQIPDGKPSLVGADDMFDPGAVTFRQGDKSIHQSYSSPEQAALVAILADLEIRGDVAVPKDADVCRICGEELNSRLETAREQFTKLAESRTGQEQMCEKIVFILMHWFSHGQDAGNN